MVALASSYPFLSILWRILICFALVIWIWTVVMALIDIFSRPDLSGWSKAAWVVFIIVLPFLGALCYLIAYSGGIAERRGRHGRADAVGTSPRAAYCERHSCGSCGV